MITYEALRKALAEEKASNRLARLPDSFFSDVKAYLEKKAQLHEKEDKWELESATNILQDLLEARERKVLNSAPYGCRTGIVPENMIPEEKEFFDRAVKMVKEFRKARDRQLATGSEAMVVEAVEDIPAFVGIDLQNYGPLAKGETAALPEENARLLIRKGAARPATKSEKNADEGPEEGENI